MDSNLVERVTLERQPHGYIFNVHDRAFANHVHEMLEPRDVTCPLAIVAMASAGDHG